MKGKNKEQAEKAKERLEKPRATGRKERKGKESPERQGGKRGKGEGKGKGREERKGKESPERQGREEGLRIEIANKIARTERKSTFRVN